MSSPDGSEHSTTSYDDTSSLDASTSDEDNIVSSVAIQPVYRFNGDLDALWDRCREFASSFTTYPKIHPLHLALTLLYDDLRHRHDARLHNPSTRTPAVERSLFWTALARSSRPTLHKSLNDHIKYSCGAGAPLPLPTQAGLALYHKTATLHISELDPVEDADEIHGERDSYCQAVKVVLDKAKALATDNEDQYMAPHHVLLALLEDSGISDALGETSPSVSIHELAQIIRGLRGSKVEQPETQPRFPILSQFAIDVTEEMNKNPSSQDPIVGRNHELRRIISVLSRKSKNSAVLIGDPGVGKTAIAKSLAWRIVRGEVSESVVARVFSLDLGSLLASTACKSSYEAILQAILDDIAAHEDIGIRAIVFIDELSQITIGGYRNDGTGIDAATLMKPYIRSGKLRCVGCATWEDYSSMIGKDGALARLFSTIFVCEPSVLETENILRSLKPGLQTFHDVHILDDAFVAASSIAARFFAHKRLPDSAIELVDEACSHTKLNADPWDQLGRWRRLQVAKELHLSSLQREYHESNDRRIAQLEDQIAVIRQQIRQHRAVAIKDRPLLDQLKELEDEIKRHDRSISGFGQGQYEDRKQVAQRIWDLELERKEIQAQLSRVRNESESNAHNELSVYTALPPTGKPEVTQKNILEVASWYRTVSCMASDTKSGKLASKIVDYYDVLSKAIVMQPDAVQAVADAAQCLTSGLNDPRRPAASFLFGGPPGSGKVLLAKQAAEALLGSAEKLIQIHGADYAHSHSLSRLIGTPVCTGFDKGGQLTECVRRRPISVVLIQEIEKACVEFRQFIQTILDEGSVKDGEGRLVDFTNCMVIITTNIGQESILQDGNTPEEDAGADVERKQYVTRIQQAFPAEFLARVDDLLVFRRITQDDMLAIVDKRLQEVALQLHRIKLDLDVREEVRIHLANVGWSRRTGASKLEGVIRAQILLPLSAAILRNDVLDKSTVRLSYDEIQDRIAVEPIPPAGGPMELVDDSASVISSLPSPETGSSNFSHPSTHATPRVTESQTPQYGFFYGSSASFPAHTASTASRITTLVTQLKPRRLF